jgi:Tfp pilus assembly protein PilX
MNHLRSVRRRLAEDEGGWALVTALMLMVVMVIGGASLMAAVDTETNSSKVERQRETAFNLAEAALNAQLFALSRDWAGKGMAANAAANTAANPYPAWCTPASTTSRCPSSPALTSAFASADAAGATWNTTVRDDGASPLDTFYSEAAIANQPGYDANKNGKLWVRAQATARGQTRTIVALVQAQQQDEDVLHAAVAAGRLNLTNDGNKPLIDGGGPVMVRCAMVANDPNGACLGQQFGGARFKDLPALMSFLQTQIPGTTPTSNTAMGTAMTPDAVARLKARAIADGTYFQTCDPTKLGGAVVWIVQGPCDAPAGNINSPDKPGMLILEKGTISVTAQTDFYGVIYALNAGSPPISGPVVTVHADGVIHGGVLVDGPGVVEVGSNKSNVVYTPNAFKAVESYGSAGVIQNTWREIKGTLTPP